MDTRELTALINCGRIFVIFVPLRVIQNWLNSFYEVVAGLHRRKRQK